MVTEIEETMGFDNVNGIKTAVPPQKISHYNLSESADENEVEKIIKPFIKTVGT